MNLIEKGDIVKRKWDGKMGEVMKDILNGTVAVQFESTSTEDVLAKADLKLVCKQQSRLDYYI